MLFLFIDKRKVSYLSITLYHLFFAFQMFLIFLKLFVFCLFIYYLLEALASTTATATSQIKNFIG